jgi:ABC-type branched-subunit amino acid transport system substrate-binding protein
VSVSLLRPHFRTAAFLAIVAWALSGCSLFGGHEKPQPPPPAAAEAPAPAASAPVTVVLIPTNQGPAAPASSGQHVEVALLLPLSGPSAALGRSLLEAAQMALFDTGGDQLELLVRDSGGAPAAAATAAHSVVDAGAKLILGPLLASEVEAVKPIAQAAGVPLVAFSTATQLAGNGTWLLAFDPRQEIQRVVGFAHAHGRNRFAALAPASAYGDIAVAALKDAVQVSGAELGPIERYDPNAASLAPTVQTFAGEGNFDAVLLPEGGTRLKALAPLLPYYGVDPDQVKFLGTGLWADQTINSEPALEGGWYAAPAPHVRQDFERRFAALYKHAPPLLATLGYDATALAAVLARQPNGADFSAAALTNPSGFSGLNGIFRLLPDGITERGLAVLELHRTGSTVIDPAPQTFQRPGY